MARKTCPFKACDWESREFDPESNCSRVAVETDAEIHWQNEHDGIIPEGADFGEFQCPECHAIHGFNGTVSCSECGHIPEEARA